MEPQFIEPQFTPDEEAYLSEKVPKYLDALIEKVNYVIAETESAADADFAENSIVFTDFSPVNADFLKAHVMESLFHKLHGGDLEMAEMMLTMMGKQAGINLSRE